MKKKLLQIIAIFCFANVQAQQETAFSQYYFNHFLINPAAAGANDFQTLFLHGRFQWTGLPNAPKTGMISYQAPFGNIGLGGTIFSDRVASLNRSGVNFAYAYRAKIQEYKLSIGLMAHYQRFYLSQNAYDGVEDPDDMTVYEAMDGLSVFDANIGFYLYDHKAYLGVSIPNIIQARLNTIGTNQSTVSQLTRQYIFMVGYKYLPENSFFSLEPSLLVRKIDPLPLQALLTVKFGMMNEQIFTSFTYGTTDVITIGMGYQLKPEAKVAYSYDYALGDIYRFTRGSHEMSFIWEFGKPDFRKPIESKRFKD